MVNNSLDDSLGRHIVAGINSAENAELLGHLIRVAAIDGQVVLGANALHDDVDVEPIDEFLCHRQRRTDDDLGNRLEL